MWIIGRWASILSGLHQSPEVYARNPVPPNHHSRPAVGVHDAPFATFSAQTSLSFWPHDLARGVTVIDQHKMSVLPLNGSLSGRTSIAPMTIALW